MVLELRPHAADQDPVMSLRTGVESIVVACCLIAMVLLILRGRE